MSESPRSTDPRVVIAVVRTGGIAGIRRRWQVEPDPDDTSEWIALIERCPWDDESGDDSGADRFMWTIRARTPSQKHERDLPDSQLSGPWRELVDAVRRAKKMSDNA
ncbi:protealysin inhibitor emfourin [Microbacterium sp.]|uniref:protealysin inhibitor emfourin n=1 Tax=Microbacterium sp. TaxID=51671 RepID=UPI0028122AF4|nr:protealysin inhibitor emfourin [Microbacterium sp.]